MHLVLPPSKIHCVCRSMEPQMEMQMDDSYDALSIDQFCKRHGFKRATYYNLIKRGEAPRFFTIGSRRFISKEAAEEWLREREAAAPAKYEAALQRRREARAKAAEAKITAKEAARA